MMSKKSSKKNQHLSVADNSQDKKQQRVDKLIAKANGLVDSLGSGMEELKVTVCTLVREDAHKIFGCKETGLIKLIDPNKCCQDYLYQIIGSAKIEKELGLDVASLVVHHANFLRTLKTADNRKKAWNIACLEAGGSEKVKAGNIKAAVETVMELEEQDSLERTTKANSSKKSNEFETEFIVKAFRKLRTGFNKEEMNHFIQILKGSEKYREVCKELSSESISEDNRRGLIGLIKSENTESLSQE